MSRVKRGVTKHRRKKKYILLGKGMRGRANRCYSIAKRSGEKRLQFQYKARRLKKRDFRTKFISIINTFCRQRNSNYSSFIYKLNNSEYKNLVDRKTFAILAQNNVENAITLYNKITN